ncbi:hypothetical protein [Acrocarpospora pleiomorpha]|nr:hypothetical protein [Acrocarpospora pleiomorpha]
MSAQTISVAGGLARWPLATLSVIALLLGYLATRAFGAYQRSI